MSSRVDDLPTLNEDEIEDEDPRIEFFCNLKAGFDWAEENSDKEHYSYTPIAQIVTKFASACKTPDRTSTVQPVVQHAIKKPDDTERSPDFGAVRVPVRSTAEMRTASEREAFLILLLEVKKFIFPNWFGDIQDLRDMIASQAQQHFHSYLRQLNEQALFALYQYPGDVVPVFLSQGNCFTLLLYPRPSNWDSIVDKYRDTLESGADHSPATGQPEPGTSHAAPPAEEESPVRQEEATAAQERVGDAVAPAARITGIRLERDTSPDTDAQEPAQLTEEVTNGAGREPEASASDASPSTSTDTAEFLFEEGDLPIALVIFFCEFILLPDGSGFTPQFLHALLAAMSFSDIKFKSSDRIFRLADGEEVNDAPTTQSLKVAEDAIEAFKAEQQARKHPEQSASASPSVETTHSNYYNRRYTIPRPTDTDVLWGLRTRNITWQSPGTISRKRKAADQADGAAAGPSKKRGRPAKASNRGSKKPGRGSGKGRA
ncbi:hypothetical protein EWM64_g5348 [Hericium alpestre]|uniref:Uncharacterized protein n=1 Tax=Hericium alpestre TaxID=135208 RepID=A0A4Y9ZX79_9AGAM|nr:hypothetical protein EWM64_g5348 [Hericium alpestre]